MPAAIGDRSASIVIPISPLAVAIVTSRFSPAARGGGCSVGQSPAAAGEPPRMGRPKRVDGRCRRAADAAGCGERRGHGEERERAAGSGHGHAAASRAAVKSMAPDRSACPRMMPVTPRSRSRRIPSRSDTPPATRKSASWVRARPASRSPSGSEPPWDRTKRRTPRDASSSTISANVGTVGSSPRERGESLRPRVQADGQPVARDGEASASRAGLLGDVHRQRRPGSPRRRRRGGSDRAPRARRRAGSGRRSATPSPRRPRGCRARRLRAPSKSTTWTTRAPSSTNRSAIRSGRSVGAPTPDEAPGQNTTRERPRSRSIDGMTCTCGFRPWRPATPRRRSSPRRPGSSRAAAADGS